MMTCKACSGQMNQEERFCTCCGRPLEATTYSVDRLMRPRYGRMIAGVCVGIAQREGWDPTLVRIAAVLCFFGGFGMVLVAYVAAWVIMPNEPLWVMPPVSGPGVPPVGVAAS